MTQAIRVIIMEVYYQQEEGLRIFREYWIIYLHDIASVNCLLNYNISLKTFLQLILQVGKLVSSNTYRKSILSSPSQKLSSCYLQSRCLPSSRGWIFLLNQFAPILTHKGVSGSKNICWESSTMIYLFTLAICTFSAVINVWNLTA